MDGSAPVAAGEAGLTCYSARLEYQRPYITGLQEERGNALGIGDSMATELRRAKRTRGRMRGRVLFGADDDPSMKRDGWTWLSDLDRGKALSREEVPKGHPHLLRIIRRIVLSANQSDPRLPLCLAAGPFLVFHACSSKEIFLFFDFVSRTLTLLLVSGGLSEITGRLQHETSSDGRHLDSTWSDIQL